MATLNDSTTIRHNLAKKILFWCLTILILLIAVFSASIWETVDLGYYHVKQRVYTGELSVKFHPETYWQMFGTVTHYKAAHTIWFSKHETEGTDLDESVPVRFSDGGRASVTGNVRVILPEDTLKFLDLHKNFRSFNNFVWSGVQPVINEAVILTAALISSEESYTTKRSYFSEAAWDQVKNGIYLTEEKPDTVTDKTGDKVIKTKIAIRYDKPKEQGGKPLRKLNSLKQYNIHLSQFVIKEIDYEDAIAKQISSKRQNLMKIIIAKADAEKAQQQRIQKEEEGKRDVIIAKYDAEKNGISKKIFGEKLAAILKINAERGFKVAEFDKKSAYENKIRDQNEGEADGYFNRSLIEADQALYARIKAYETGQLMMAASYAAGQNPFPDIVISHDTKMSATDLPWQSVSLNAMRDLLKKKQDKQNQD